MYKQPDAIFQPSDKSHFYEMLRAEIILHFFNRLGEWHVLVRRFLLKKLFYSIEKPLYEVASPFRCQYGNKIHIGKNFFANMNCIIMDHADVFIGDNVLLGPNVTITTVTHPKCAEQRNVRPVKNSFHPQKLGGVEIAKPVHIGDNVWIAANAVICAGVTIGNNSVIGAGSVVTRDIPANSLAVGVPCHVVQQIDDSDKIPDAELYLNQMERQG